MCHMYHNDISLSHHINITCILGDFHVITAGTCVQGGISTFISMNLLDILKYFKPKHNLS